MNRASSSSPTPHRQFPFALPFWSRLPVTFPLIHTLMVWRLKVSETAMRGCRRKLTPGIEGKMDQKSLFRVLEISAMMMF